MSRHQLEPDTQAILLLCSALGSGTDTPTPLTLDEYNALAGRLYAAGRRPRDLLADLPLPSVAPAGESTRLAALLARGVVLALAVERWTGQGLWVLSRAEAAYPGRIKRRLGRAAPPVLWGAGDRRLLARPSVAVTGGAARGAGTRLAERLGALCAGEEVGVLTVADQSLAAATLSAALAAGGWGAALPSVPLSRAAVAGEHRAAVRGGQLALLTLQEPERAPAFDDATQSWVLIAALAEAVIALDTGGHADQPASLLPAELRRLGVPLFVMAAGGGLALPVAPAPPPVQRLLARVRRPDQSRS